MRTKPRESNRGFTRVDVVAIFAILLVLLAATSPTWVHLRSQRQREKCVNNLKNIGLASRIFSTGCREDHPWWNPIAEGGTKEYTTDARETWAHFAAHSNELSTPMLLHCPADRQRIPADSFVASGDPGAVRAFVRNDQLSYFLNLGQSEEDPESIASGDRNLTTNGVEVASSSRFTLSSKDVLGWTDGMHRKAGNILLGDGSVHQVTPARLTEAWRQLAAKENQRTNVWLVP